MRGLCLVFGLRDAGGGWVGGGMRATEDFVYLKWASRLWLCVQSFIFPQKKIFLVLGGWVVWPRGGGPPDHPPPFPVDKHIPGRSAIGPTPLLASGGCVGLRGLPPPLGPGGHGVEPREGRSQGCASCSAHGTGGGGGLSIQNFISPERKTCLVLGGWVGVWPGGGGGLSARSPPSPVDKHIPGGVAASPPQGARQRAR